MTSPNTPVIVGTGQVSQRFEDPRAGAEPLGMMEQALAAAAEDAGAPELLRRASRIAVIRGLWPYADPARELARRFGASGAETVGTPLGGNYSQIAVSDAAKEIQAGRRDVVLVAGAENGRSSARARRQAVELDYSEAPGAPDLLLGDDKAMVHPAETARRIVRPPAVYAIFESALRAARGENLVAHAARIARLWEGFNAVARDNPHAWIRKAWSADEIGRASPENPMIGLPYTRLMNANNRVDQGAAIILCSLATADALGVPEEKRVFPHVGTQANDTQFVSTRRALHRSPAIRLAGGRALELSGRGIDEIAHLDVYSCFPSAVQVAANELGIAEGRPLTVTGGLTFGGGPLNCYVLNAIARMAEILRDDPGSRGLVTANGGYLTKHAFGIYSTEPPAKGFLHEDLQREVDALPQREALVDFEGPVSVEGFTVMFEHGEPALGHAACLTEEGRRTWGNVEDRDLLGAMGREELCGRAGRLDGAGRLSLA